MILYAVVLHSLDVALLVWFTLKVWRGRRWARIALTGYLVVASILSLISAAEGIEYLVIVIPTDVIHLIMLGLLWLPTSVRAFFAPRRPAALARPGFSD